ncbi:aspartate/glutamate racemase family protein [Marinobacterium litorale]|uniref:aspartate/glutamate racemase family protein n=1 Tax=Marinobacterium litorale TaxID=404770 RepID=UPI00040798D3|nr:aspartate/glutamate racemase family protein [Marinobacterium litorale]
MKLRVINPNDSQLMTEMIAHSCRSVAPMLDIDAVCAGAGVASVEGFYDGARATSGVLDRIAEGETAGCEGYLIACADDTALHAARELAQGPVLGIGEAAMHAASLLGCGFSILTAQQKSVHILASNARSYGFGVHCQGVHAMQLPVLELEHSDNTDLQANLIQRAQQIIAQDHSEVLVLGCAGLTTQQPMLQQALGLPVIDGVRVGILLLEALVRAGLRTSKHCSYSRAG